MSPRLSVAGDMAIGPTPAERFGLDDPAAWPAGFLDWNTSPVDLSFSQCGGEARRKRGFLKVERTSSCSRTARWRGFCGNELDLLRACSEPRGRSVKRRGAAAFRAGLSTWCGSTTTDSPWANPNIFRRPEIPGHAEPELRHAEKPRLVDQCASRTEGIYVWLDLHVGRNLKAGDRIYGFEEISKGKPLAELKGYKLRQPEHPAGDEAVQTKPTSTTAMSTRTPATRTSPPSVALLITNENDLTNHFGNALLPDKNVPKAQRPLPKARPMPLLPAANGLPKRKTCAHGARPRPSCSSTISNIASTRT